MHVTCVDWTDVSATTRAARAREAGHLARPARPRRRSTASGTRAATRRTATTATRTGSRRARTPLWANDGEPYDPERGAARARARRARTSSRRIDGRRRRLRHRALRPPLARGRRRSCERVLELARRRARSRRRRRRRRRRRPARRAGARARDLRTWSRGELAWTQRSAELRRARRATASPRALRELLALQSSDWAFLIDSAHRRRLPARARRAHHAAFVAALAGRELRRSCAIWLPSWRIGRSCSPELKFCDRPGRSF